MSVAARLEVRGKDKTTLRRWARSTAIPAGLARRARIVLLAGGGVPNAEIARRVGVSRPTVIGWRERYLEGGTAALDDRPRPGRAKQIDEAEVVVALWRSRPSGSGSPTGPPGCWPASWGSGTPRSPESGPSGTCSPGGWRRSSSVSVAAVLRQGGPPGSALVTPV